MENAAGVRSADQARGSQSSPARRDPTYVDPVTIRIIAGFILAGSLAILGVGMYLHPDPAGVGSHQQLGLPPCSFLAVTGYPCATCGMTTAVTHVAHGQIFRAFYVQPAGALFGLAVVAATMISAYSLVTACSLVPIGRWFWRPRVIVVLGVIVLLAWVYKIILVRGSL